MTRRIIPRSSVPLLLVVSLGVMPVVFSSTARAESASWLFASLLREKKILTYMRMPVSGKLVRLDEISTPAEQPGQRTADGFERGCGR